MEGQESTKLDTTLFERASTIPSNHYVSYINSCIILTIRYKIKIIPSLQHQGATLDEKLAIL